MKNRYENLTMRYFNLDKKSPDYSEEWEHVHVFIDHETREVVTRFTSRWNSSYDREERVKL